MTVSLNQLDRKGFIRLWRARIQIAHRKGLIGAANGTYGIAGAAAPKTGRIAR